MVHETTDNDSAFPPGTVTLEDLQVRDETVRTILLPRPSRDPNDPLNWALTRKYLNFGLVCCYTLLVFSFITVAIPTWEPMHEELGFNYQELNNSYALGSAGVATGAVLLTPFALKFGRRQIYIISLLLQIGVCIWEAQLQKVPELYLVTFLSCFLGSLAEIMIQMTVADVFFIHQRGAMNSIFIFCQQIGTAVSPVVAGYITTSLGWRAVWWAMAISLATALLAFVFLYEESKYFGVPTEGMELEIILETSTTGHPDENHETKQKPETKSDKQTAETAPLDKLPPLYDADIDESIPSMTYKQRLLQFTIDHGSISQLLLHIYQPFHIMLYIPGILYMAIVYGVSWAIMTIIGTNMATFMPAPPYNFSASAVGLMILPVFVGTAIGMAIVGPTSDRLILYLAKRNNGIYEPEMRLWLLAAFIPLVPTGLMVAGSGFQYTLPWPVIAVGFGSASLGITPAISISLTYVTDAYTEILGDAMVGITFMRNVPSLVIPFFLLPWIRRIGILNVYIVVSVISTVIFMVTFIFIIYGKRIRTATATRYRWFASRQFNGRT